MSNCSEQKKYRLDLTKEELDVLNLVVSDKGRLESKQATLIWRLRRAYRKACRAAGLKPSYYLLFSSPVESVVPLPPQDLSREYHILGDILERVYNLRRAPDDDDYEFNDYGQPLEIVPGEDEEYEYDEDDADDADEDFPGGWIVC
jgi:hypothetical protein